MFARLLHWLRLLIEPSGSGRLRGFGPNGWRVKYDPTPEIPDGAYSQRMAYDVACNYAELFGGKVERASGD